MASFADGKSLRGLLPAQMLSLVWPAGLGNTWLRASGRCHSVAEAPHPRGTHNLEFPACLTTICYMTGCFDMPSVIWHRLKDD
mgnify:CR=1 FL=1